MVDQRSSRRAKLRTVLVVAAGAALLALTVFKVPLATILLVGVWLVCPLMMMGMHGGGRGRSGTGRVGDERARVKALDEHRSPSGGAS